MSEMSSPTRRQIDHMLKPEMVEFYIEPNGTIHLDSKGLVEDWQVYRDTEGRSHGKDVNQQGRRVLITKSRRKHWMTIQV